MARWKLVLLLAVVGCLLVIGTGSISNISSIGSVDAGAPSLRRLEAHYTFSGVFFPTAVDTNGDRFGAAAVIEEIQGGKLVGNIKSARLIKQGSMVEYGIMDPANMSTLCFRVNEDDFSVEENAY